MPLTCSNTLLGRRADFVDALTAVAEDEEQLPGLEEEEEEVEPATLDDTGSSAKEN
jgi:hypothetical protein